MTRWNGREDYDDDNDGCGMQWIPLLFMLAWLLILLTYVTIWVSRW